MGGKLARSGPWRKGSRRITLDFTRTCEFPDRALGGADRDGAARRLRQRKLTGGDAGSRITPTPAGRGPCSAGVCKQFHAPHPFLLLLLPLPCGHRRGPRPPGPKARTMDVATILPRRAANLDLDPRAGARCRFWLGRGAELRRSFQMPDTMTGPRFRSSRARTGRVVGRYDPDRIAGARRPQVEAGSSSAVGRQKSEVVAQVAEVGVALEHRQLLAGRKTSGAIAAVPVGQEPGLPATRSGGMTLRCTSAFRAHGAVSRPSASRWSTLLGGLPGGRRSACCSSTTATRADQEEVMAGLDQSNESFASVHACG